MSVVDNVVEEGFKSAEEVALRSLFHARVPVMLVSDPGMGKTATIRSIAKEMDYELVILVPSRMDAQDLSGFPTRGELPQEDENGNIHIVPVTEFAPQMWQKFIMKNKRVILFLDEFSNAHPSVRASLLSFIQDRQFPNGEYFPDETIIVGAMNPIDTAADGFELDKATTNRIAFIDWKPDFDGWIHGMRTSWGKESSEREQQWRNDITQFIIENPAFLHKTDTQSIKTTEATGVSYNSASSRTVATYAWPSRRSWDNLARALGSQNNSNNSYVEDLILRGIVGAESAIHFRRWIEENNKLDVKGIIANPDGYKKWNSITANEVNTLMPKAIESISPETIYNVIRIFEILEEKNKGSFAAGYLLELSKTPAKVRKNLTDTERGKLTDRILSVIAKYNQFTNNN